MNFNTLKNIEEIIRKTNLPILNEFLLRVEKLIELNKLSVLVDLKTISINTDKFVFSIVGNKIVRYKREDVKKLTYLKITFTKQVIGEYFFVLNNKFHGYQTSKDSNYKYYYFWKHNVLL